VAEEVTESGISFLGEIGPDGLLHDIAISNPFWEACPLYDRESPKIPKTFHIRGIYAGIITDGIIILSNDPSSHPQSIGVPPGHPPLTCFLGAPLKQEDRTIGMIAVGNREGGYGPDDRRTMEVLAQVISEALARRRTEEALRQSEIRYRSLFMHSPDAIFISRNDRVTLVNDACLNLFGALKAEKLLGKASFDLFHADYHPAIREHLKRMQDSSEALSLPEGKIIRLDGFSVEVEVIAAHFPFNGSSAIHIILRDITARRRAARDLEHSNKELEQFAYAASHDLQEPLRSIVSFLQLLQHHYKDRIDEKGRQYIERAVAAGNRMQTLIRDLLSLSHVTTGDCRFEPTDLNRLVETVLDNLESTLRLNNADVVHTDLPSLSVDGSQIRSLFQNLIANGIKYNKDPSPRVAISCRRYDNGYEFLVKDNGIGIEPRFHEHIFMVFQRLHAAGEYEGTGLGLALCRKIVERHGGTIWVESNPGEGSTFHFTLPKSR
jgi:PAS domain S-box-containing protein